MNRVCQPCAGAPSIRRGLNGSCPAMCDRCSIFHEFRRLICSQPMLCIAPPRCPGVVASNACASPRVQYSMWCRRTTEHHKIIPPCKHIIGNVQPIWLLSSPAFKFVYHRLLLVFLIYSAHHCISWAAKYLQHPPLCIAPRLERNRFATESPGVSLLNR